MKKLRFKNRNGVLYFGIDDKFKSSKLKYNSVNKNIIQGKYNNGFFDSDLNIKNISSELINDLVMAFINSESSIKKNSTLRNYQSAFKNHIKPYFEGKTVLQIKPIDIKLYQDYIQKKGINGKAVIGQSRFLLSEIFQDYILSGDIAVNPVKMVNTPAFKKTAKKQSVKVFTLDEIDLILENAFGDFKNLLGILFFTGMRIGELLALKWSDVDFKTDTITINKTVSAGAIGTPKTMSSDRDVEMLSQAKEFFKKQILLTGMKNTFVFLNSKQSHYTQGSHLLIKFTALLQDLNMQRRTLHTARHTFASVMLNNNIDPMWVSATLGHENVKITLEIYAHFLPRKEKMKMEFLDKRYKNGTML
ncbi:MAG: tyrosine-type recombinase/integrase [Sulfurimonas sp.]